MKGKKYGGRTKGTPNKPKPYMAMLEATLEKYMAEPNDKGVTALERDLASIEDPKDRLYAVEKFLNYIKPKKQAIQADLTLDVDRTIEDNLNDML